MNATAIRLLMTFATGSLIGLGFVLAKLLLNGVRLATSSRSQGSLPAHSYSGSSSACCSGQDCSSCSQASC
jgi:hypothetical protein